MDAVLVIKLIFVGLAGYLLGSANTALILGKFHGVDVRRHGSGNAGATNTLRVLGKKAAVIVTLGDVLKGIAACLIGHAVIGEVGGIGNLGVMLGGVAAIVGHNWPVYFGFKGGKGIWTTFAVILMMDWRIGLVLILLFAIVVVASRYISLGSVVGSALFPFVSLLPVFGKSTVFVIFAALLGIMAIIRHRANIRRILNGTEAKFGQKKA